MPLAQQLGTARQRIEEDECRTFRLESVRHAKEGHLGPRGVQGGLAMASNLLSFEEEEDDDDEEEEGEGDGDGIDCTDDMYDSETYDEQSESENSESDE